MAYETLIVAERGSVRVVSVNRPSVLNALNRRTLMDLEQLLIRTNEENSIRALVITGAGEKSFIAGADIGEMRHLSPIDAEQFSQLGHRVFDILGSMRIPVIAAVNGYALGGGLELALACDFIYASENASFGLVESKLGIIPGFGGIARLTRRVGDAYARELIFSAAQITAEEAFRVGLANRVLPAGEVVHAATAICERMAQRGPHALNMVKQLVREGQNIDLRAANKLEQQGFGLIFSTQDRIEGINAFLEKRNPQF